MAAAPTLTGFKFDMTRSGRVRERPRQERINEMVVRQGMHEKRQAMMNMRRKKIKQEENKAERTAELVIRHVDG